MNEFDYRENTVTRVQGAQIPISYVKVPMANGFDCPSKRCGLCCVTPTGERSFKRVPFGNLHRCEHFDIGARLCNRYESRPFMCRLFPFLVIPSSRGLIFSPNLECPFFSETNQHFGLNELIAMMGKDNELANGIKSEYLDSLTFMESEGEKLRDVFIYDCKIVPRQVPVTPADPEIIRATVERNLKGTIKFEDFFQEVNDFVSKCWTEVYSECSYPDGSLKRSVLDDVETRSKNRPLKSLPELIINFNESEWASYIKPNLDGKDPSLMAIKNNGPKILIKDIFEGKNWEIKISKISPDLDFSPDARKMFFEYAKLIFLRELFFPALKREYAISIGDSNSAPGLKRARFEAYVETFFTPFLYFLADALLFCARDATNHVDKQLCREIISSVDSRVPSHIY